MIGRRSLPLRAAGVGVLLGLSLVACGRGELKSPTRLVESDVRSEVKKAEATVPSDSLVTVDHPELAGLFIRVADALMPMACLRRGRRGADEPCLAQGNAEPARLYPAFFGEANPAQAKRDAIYMVMPDEWQSGLLLPGGKNDGETGSDGPFRGFATVSTRNPLRFTSAGLQRLTESNAPVCEATGCSGPLLEELRTVEVLAVSPELEAAARLAVRSVQVTGLRYHPAQEPAKSIATLVSAQEERLIALPIDVYELMADGESERTFRTYFLVAQRGREFRQLSIAEASSYGLGEVGDVAALVDLDGDGTDELLLHSPNSNAYSYRAVRRDLDRLVVLGEFKFGC